MLRTSAIRSMRAAAASQPLAVRNVRFLGSRSNEAPLEQGLVEKYKLNDPSRFVPIALGAGLFSSLTGLYHFNAESQILGLFILFTGTVYAKGGEGLGKMLDDVGDAILKEQNALEDAQIAATKLVIEAHKRQAVVFDDIKDIFEGQKAMMDQIVSTHNLKLKHEIRNRIARQLEHAAVVDEQLQSSLKTKMIDAATEYVRQNFDEVDEQVYDKALQASLSAMKNPKALSQSPVGDMFKNFFAQTRQELSKIKNTPISLTESMKEQALEVARAAARRDGLEGVDIKVPSSFTLGNRV